MVIFKDNPEFKVAYEHEQTGIIFYEPAEITSYHKAREMAMASQDAYSRCGISRELLANLADTLIQFGNKNLHVDTLRTDIGVIGHNIKYRTEHIVDEMCAIRMGALALFLDGEDPGKVVEAWTAKKVALAMEHPDMYTFFLERGIAFTPEYSEVLRGLMAQDYLTERQMALNMLTVKSTPQT